MGLAVTKLGASGQPRGWLSDSQPFQAPILKSLTLTNNENDVNLINNVNYSQNFAFFTINEVTAKRDTCRQAWWMRLHSLWLWLN